MRLVLFSKFLAALDVPGLIARAQSLGIEGYDLCVRPGHAVGPDNLRDLPAAVAAMRRAGLDVPLVTAPTDLVLASDPRAAPYLEAMRAAGVPRIKIGYFDVDRGAPYWDQVERIRAELARWADLADRFAVTVMYHTHSGSMGQNASALMHLIRGLPAERIAGYLDPGHLVFCGEPFPFAAAVAAEQLAAVGLKDGHRRSGRFLPAGRGDVDWTAVFDTLADRGFTGPLSVHAEYETSEGQGALALLPLEVSFFRTLRDGVLRRRAEPPRT